MKEKNPEVQQKKLENFIRLAKSRGSKLIDKFRVLKSLGSNSYKVDEETAKQVLQEIETAYNNLKKAWKVEEKTKTAETQVTQQV